MSSDSETPTPSPEQFGSVKPTPEQLRREQRAMALKDAYEREHPDEVIFLNIWSPRFADDPEAAAAAEPEIRDEEITLP